MYYSALNQEKFNGLKKDIIGSISESIENLFNSSHVVEVRTEGNRTYLTFESVNDSGELQKETVWFYSGMFSVSE